MSNDSEDIDESYDIEYNDDDSMWLVFDINKIKYIERQYDYSLNVMKNLNLFTVSDYYGGDEYIKPDLDDIINNNDIYIYSIYLELRIYDVDYTDDINSLGSARYYFERNFSYNFTVDNNKYVETGLISTSVISSIKNFKIHRELDNEHILLYELQNFILQGGILLDDKCELNMRFFDSYFQCYSIKLHIRCNQNKSQYESKPILNKINKNVIVSDLIRTKYYKPTYNELIKIHNETVEPKLQMPLFSDGDYVDKSEKRKHDYYVEQIDSKTYYITIKDDINLYNNNIFTYDFVIFTIKDVYNRNDFNDIWISSISIIDHQTEKVYLEYTHDDLIYYVDNNYIDNDHNMIYILVPINYEFDNISIVRDYFKYSDEIYDEINKSDDMVSDRIELDSEYVDIKLELLQMKENPFVFGSCIDIYYTFYKYIEREEI